MKTIRAHWAKYSNNFGDILTPYILRHLGAQAVFVGRGTPNKFLAVGTLMERVKAGDTVWGSGAIPQKRGRHFQAPPNVTFLAVRGPKTRELVVGAEVPEVYGDPGLLLPRFYTPKRTSEFSVGIIPHEVEKDVQVPTDDPSVLVIDINAGVHEVINAVAKCDLVLSSSLHGVVVAEAYGIPAVWVRMTNRIHGGNYKYNDYLISTGREPRGPMMWTGDNLAEAEQHVLPPAVLDTSPLLDAFVSHYKLEIP